MVLGIFYLYSQPHLEPKCCENRSEHLFPFLVDVVIGDLLLRCEGELWQGRKRLWCDTVTHLPGRQRVGSWYPKSVSFWGDGESLCR